MSAVKQSKFSPAGLLLRNAEIISSRGFPAEYLFTALDHLDVGISVVNRRFRYRGVNRALAKMDRVPVEEHSGKPLDIIIGSLATIVGPIIERIFSSGQPLANIRHCGPLPARPQPGQWLKFYFPVRDIRGRVTEVGALLIELEPQAGRQPSPDPAQITAGGLLGCDKTEKPGQSGWDCFRTPDPFRGAVHLSQRECGVLGLLAEGKINKEISDILDISVKTVETYRARIMRKVGAPSLVHLVHYAIRHGIVGVMH